MCGLAAAAGLTVPPDRALAALAALARRGPDGAGSWRGDAPPVWLGHRRLAILDLSEAAAQPLANEDGSIQLVCNGEVYNHPDLRRHLEVAGHRYGSGSDSETILHAYEEWGDDCVDRLTGMFAFVLWDSRRRRLMAARDHLGIKPLAWAAVEGGIVLASDLGAMLPLLPRPPSPDAAALAYVTTIGHVPAPLSIWQGVNKLPPGHRLTWSETEGPRLTRWWALPEALDHGTRDADWPDLFERVVGDHLMADVPLGLLLSGGLDSTALATVLARCHPAITTQPSITTLTVGFPDAGALDEGPVAAETARHLGLANTPIPLVLDNVHRLMAETMAAVDEPQGYSALLPMFALTREAATHHKAVLAGDGGDECFAGYGWYDRLTPRPRRGAGILRRLLRPLVTVGAPPALRRAAARAFAESSVLHRHAWRQFPRFLPEEAEHLLAPMGLRFDDEAMLAPMAEHFIAGLPLKRALQRVDLMTFCSGSIIAKIDRTAMAHGLEVRVPFLDRRIVEWALARPVRADEDGPAKPLLRKMLDGRVPPSILTRPKQGFSMRAAAGLDWDDALARIAQGPWIRQGLWSRGWRRLVEPGVPFREARIWTLLMLTAWGERWLGSGRTWGN